MPCAGWLPGPWPSWRGAFQVARFGFKPGAFSNPPLGPVAQEVFANELREAQYTILQGPDHRPSMVPPSFSSPCEVLAQWPLYAGRPGLTTASKCGLPPPFIQVSPYITASRDVPQSEFMLIIYVYLLIFHPLHRNPVLYQGSNLRPSTCVVCGECNARDTASNQYLNLCSPIKKNASRMHHFKFASGHVKEAKRNT